MEIKNEYAYSCSHLSERAREGREKKESEQDDKCLIEMNVTELLTYFEKSKHRKR